MRARTWLARPAAALAVLLGTAACGGTPATQPSRPAAAGSTPAAAADHTSDHAVTAAEPGRGRSASMLVTDPYAAGSKLQKVEYHLHDGYTKRVIIPGGAYVAAEDIAICGTAGMRYPDNGFTGTGLSCKPALHAREVFYQQHTGDLAGRFSPHRNVEVTEICHGHGRYLTFGHIDHGALMSVEYYWANGEHLTVHLRGDALVSHIRLITTGGHLAAVVTRHS